MKKIFFAAVTAVMISCGMGVASAYSYNQEHLAKATANSCSCTRCACDDCKCTDCSKGDCKAACCEKGAGCSTECAHK